MIRILFTGGGTGGHIYPILAVAEKLKAEALSRKINADFFYLGAAGDFEALIGESGIKVYKIVSSKIRRYFDLGNIFDIPKFFISVFQAFWRVFWIMPDVLFSKGGSGSLPVVLAARFYRIPVVAHESDSAPGLANIAASKFAQRIGISFASAYNEFVSKYSGRKKEIIAKRIALIGNPVREFLFGNCDKQRQGEIKKNLGFDFSRPLILVIGGSQGSTRINDFILNGLDEIIGAGYQVYHQTGINNYGGFAKEIGLLIQKFPKEQKNFYKPTAYFENNIKDAYCAADLIISRSGSGSIFEIAASGKPSILIPLEESANGHQKKNAYEYAATGAAAVIEESNLKPNIAVNEIKKILSDADTVEKMSAAAKKFSRPDAAKILAEEIIKAAE